MRWIFIVAVVVVCMLGCTDIGIQEPNAESRIKIVECTQHGFIQGDKLRTVILSDVKTDKKYLVVNIGINVSITPLE